MKRLLVYGMMDSYFSRRRPSSAKRPSAGRALFCSTAGALWGLLVKNVALVVALMTGLILILAPGDVTSQPVPVDKLHVCISPSGEVKIIRIPEIPNLPTRCPQGWKEIVVPTRGPRGAQGDPGLPGPPGTPGGRDCWDLNENGGKDLATEDANGDGRVDVLDCKGPKGDKGDTGPLAQIRCETVQRTYNTDIDLYCPSGYTALFAICEGASMGTLIFADQSSGLVSYLIPPGAAATGVHCAALAFTTSTARLRCCKTAPSAP
jgi:hypothetical protein